VETVVLEAEYPGFGASGRNHGQVVPSYSRHTPDQIVARFGKERGEALNQWVHDSCRLVFDLIRKHGIDCDAVQNGWLMPAHSEERLAGVRARYDQWAARGASAPGTGGEIPQPADVGHVAPRPLDRHVAAEQAVPPVDQHTEIGVALVQVVVQPVSGARHPEDHVGMGVLELVRKPIEPAQFFPLLAAHLAAG